MPNIRLALVGAGNIAQNIHLPILRSMPGVQIEAIVDRNASKARILAERHGAVRTNRTLTEALRGGDIDGVIVTTSTDAHAEVALESIEAGIPVFIERPIARTLQETMDIRAAARDKHVPVMVGMNHRFRPDVALMKNAIERGEVGSVFYVKAGYVKPRSTDARWLAQADKSGGGVLIDLGITMIDLILYVFNFGRVRSVVANAYHQETKSVEDVVVGSLFFENGAVATLETSWSLMRPEDLYYCNVFGKKGSAFINPFKLVRRTTDGFQTITPQQQKFTVTGYRKTYETELKHFVNGIRGLVPMISTVDEAVERMKVVEAMYASAELQREIVIP